MALVQKWFILEEADADHRDPYIFYLTHPSREYYGSRDTIFNHYGYDTKEAALAALEEYYANDKYKYGTFFVIDRWGRAD